MIRIIAVIITFSSVMFGQKIDFQKENIKTVLLRNVDSYEAIPLITFGEQLELKFDDLDGFYKNYKYKIVRFDHNWQKSQIFESQYLKGSNYNFVKNFEQSRGTKETYYNYKIKFPNDRIKILLSGNYAIQIFDKNENNIVLQKRFLVYENSAELLSRSIPNYNNKNTQSIDIKLVSKHIDIIKNSQNINTYIIKNNNWNGIKKAKQTFIANNQIEYRNQTFLSGNEFRWFDTKSLISSSMTTFKTDISLVENNILLNIDVPFSSEQYGDLSDINGGFVIRNIDHLDEYESDKTSDYANIHFALDYPNSSKDFDIFVVGAFNNWDLTDKNKLYYDKSDKLFKATILLKQGYYNYQYIVKNKKTGNIQNIDGDFWQTENQYLLLTYYRNWNDDFDKLIGFSVINSRE